MRNKLENIIKIYRGIKLEYKANRERKQKLSLKIESRGERKRIFIMQTPTHRNLGDHAIAYAEIEFCKNKLPEYEIVEVTYDEVYSTIDNIKSIIKKDDIVFIIGGGNMGDMYVYEEYMRRFIITNLKNNKIISFPQTISFSNDFYGKYELNKSKKVYQNNKNLTLVAREKKSYDIMKAEFPTTKVIMTPDIVLSLNITSNEKRSGIVTCIREDLESILNESNKKNIFRQLNKITSNINITDTLTTYDISAKKRKEELLTIWDKFRSAEIVITDRLHGMIFCVITGTPCIVFKNSNHKIEETYNTWLSDFNFIKLCKIDECKNINLIIDELLLEKENNKRDINIEDKFIPLINVIKNDIKG